MSRYWTLAVIPVAVALAAAPPQAGMAQAPVSAPPVAAPGPAAQPTLGYEAWKHRPGPGLHREAGMGPQGYYALWDHDEPLAVRAERVADWWALFPGDFVNTRHPRYYAFFDPPAAPGYKQAWQQRFLDEARAGGDVIVPFPARREEDGPLVTMYAVFAAGTPPERIVVTLATHLLRIDLFGLRYGEFLAFITPWLASQGLPATEEDVFRGRGTMTDHPPASYEEWLYGVYSVSLVPIPYWPYYPLDPRCRCDARTDLAARMQSAVEWWDRQRELGLLPWIGSHNRQGIFPPHFSYLWIGEGDPDDAFELRWLAEASARGDTVFQVPGDRPAAAATPSRQLFWVFEAGAPPDMVERVLRRTFERWQWSEPGIEAALRIWRAAAEIPAMEAAPPRIRGTTN